MENVGNILGYDGFEDLGDEAGSLFQLTEEAIGGLPEKRLTIGDLTKEEAERLYLNEGCSILFLSKTFHASGKTILNKFKEWEIKTRKRTEAVSAANLKRKIHIDINELQDLINSLEYSIVDIAKKYNTSHTLIRNLLKEYSIDYTEVVKLSEEKKRNILKRPKSENWRKKHQEAVCGPNHYLWKGGITSVYEKLRKCIEYNSWRKKCFERDNYTCTECGDSSGGNLQVDHIKPFSYILTENNISSFEDGLKCQELWDINNGRTLCVVCHRKTDTYGPAALKYNKEDKKDE